MIEVAIIPEEEGTNVPMAAAQSASVRIVEDAPNPAAGVVTEERSQRPDSNKSGAEKAPRPEPFKFEFSQ